MSASGPPPPDGRYGDSRRRLRPGTVAVLVVLAGAFGAWVLWAALGAATPDIRSELLGFRIISARSVEVRLQVTADARRAVTCTVQAEDRDRAPVGIARAVLPAGTEGTRRATVDVRTRAKAVTAVISGCRLERPPA